MALPMVVGVWSMAGALRQLFIIIFVIFGHSDSRGPSISVLVEHDYV